MENNKIIIGKKLYSYKTAKTLAMTAKILAFLLVFMGVILTFQSLILGILAIFFGVFMLVYSTILKKIIYKKNNTMSREAKKWHKEKDKEVKKMIKKAKKEGMHPSFINLLKAQDKLKKSINFTWNFTRAQKKKKLQNSKKL